MSLNEKFPRENQGAEQQADPVFEQNCVEYEWHQPMIDLMASTAKILHDSGIPGAERSSVFFDASSQICADIKAGATSWRALDIIYNFTSTENDHIANFWVNMRNAQAVRNRLKLSKRLIRAGLLRRNDLTGRGTEDNPLQLLSLAAGSAQGVIEEVARLKWQDGIFVDVLLIDLDPEAETVVKQKADLHRVSEHITFVGGRVDHFDRFVSSDIDMIEMLGLLDYFPEPLAVRLCRKIWKHLPAGGYFLTCHIHDNPERYFLQYVIDWGNKPYMHYRSREEFGKILTRSGIVPFSLYTEPHEIHSIAVGIKQ